MDNFTLEGFCEQLKNQFIFFNSLYIKNVSEYNLYFNDTNPPMLEVDAILKEINKYSIDISLFRKLARGDEWRSYWSANKNKIFNKPSTQWTDEQRTLVVFSKMYDSAKESPDCPPDPVFDDDDMFDGWLLVQHEKYKENKNTTVSDNKKNSKMSRAQEMFVVAKNVKDAADVQEMNTVSSKSILRERNNAIQKFSSLDETQLPDIKREINKQAQEMFKAKFKNK
jgi:hypothetical protein